MYAQIDAIGLWLLAGFAVCGGNKALAAARGEKP